MSSQLDRLEEFVEAKLNKRPNCLLCQDRPEKVDGCNRCKGSGLEPIIGELDAQIAAANKGRASK